MHNNQNIHSAENHKMCTFSYPFTLIYVNLSHSLNFSGGSVFLFLFFYFLTMEQNVTKDTVHKICKCLSYG